MNYTTTHIIYFSPTHTSQRIARAVGDGIGMGKQIEMDLTVDRNMESIVVRDALTVIAVPVYAGRVAPTALQRIKRLRGENSPSILIVVYGNRDYEDALVELRDAAIEQGFVPLAAGAFIGEHSYSKEETPIAKGRPDADDLKMAQDFGKQALSKLISASALSEIYPYYIKGNVPYRYVAPSTPAAPVLNKELCVVCSECVELCPTAAISINSEGIVETDIMKCIKCCACVKGCPAGARIFDTLYSAMLHEKCSVRREVEIFI